MKLCKYGRNRNTRKCNKPCRKATRYIARGEDGRCERRKRTRCQIGKEWVQFLQHGECLPECTYRRNHFTMQCED